MGKVYDALRRAEEQRVRSRGGEPADESLGWAAEPPASERRRSAPFYRRWAGALRPGRRRRGFESGEDANKRRISLLQPDSFAAEQFRTLRARIDALASERPIRSIAVTSALSGEGKTTAAINLALVMSMSLHRKVLLMECDMRGPTVRRTLGLRPDAGLAEVLSGDVEADKAIVRADGTQLDVLPVHREPVNPAELLDSPAMRETLEELLGRYDSVILDACPTLGLPDAKMVSELVDGLVLVVRAASTPQEDVEAALDILDRRRVLGLLLNAAKIDAQRYHYGS